MELGAQSELRVSVQASARGASMEIKYVDISGCVGGVGGAVGGSVWIQPD